MKDINKRLSVLIRKKRRALELTQEELAEKLDLNSKQSVYNLETGKAKILFSTFYKAAIFLEIDLKDI